MTEKHRGSSSSRTGANPWVERRVAAHLKRREDECILILARAYIDVAAKLNGDRGKTLQLFDEFTRTVAKALVPQRRRGKANPTLDARILAAGGGAPRGQKEVAIADAACAQDVRQVDAARRRYNRLSAERDAREKWLAEVVADVRRKIRLGSRRPLFENTEPSPSPSPAEGTNT